MNLSYFLGANTADGFYSRFDAALPQEGFLRVLKGGPGCGKSTLMKKVATHAGQLGLTVHRILCSSDPGSLDGVYIPAIGYAVVDGTAPHVVEPALCGCNGKYLDLGAGYDTAGLRHCRGILGRLKAAAADCYPAVTAALQAAAALERCREGTAPDRELLRKKLAEQGPGGSIRTVFLSGYTPEGYMVCRETAEALCPVICTVRGPAEAVSAFLKDGAKLAAERGWDCLLGDSPLLPGRWADSLLVPGLGIGFIRDTPASPWNGRTSGSTGRLKDDGLLDAMQRRLLEDAGRQLAKARELHGLLEEAYRPHLDFGAANRAALDCCAEVEILAGDS